MSPKQGPPPANTVELQQRLSEAESEIRRQRSVNRMLTRAIDDLLGSPPGVEMTKINKLLHEYGIDYPTGSRGVHDLVQSAEFNRDYRKECMTRHGGLEDF